MSNLSKELIRELIKEEEFSSTKEIMEAIKGMFQEVLQEAMEAEMDGQLAMNVTKKANRPTVVTVTLKKW